MKREDIEKAARYAIIKHYNCGMCCDLADCVHCYGCNTAYDCQECGADEFKEGFLKGANWLINSVWHDASEKPRRNKWYIAQIGDDAFDTFTDSVNWKSYARNLNIIRWAYIEDLIPNTEERVMNREIKFNSQIATTREQSERLLDLGVSSDTADMYLKYDGNPYLVTYTLMAKDRLVPYTLEEKDIPAWSLSRLLKMIPVYIGEHLQLKIAPPVIGYWNYEMQKYERHHSHVNIFENCVDIISWLITNRYFNKEYLKGGDK